MVNLMLTGTQRVGQAVCFCCLRRKWQNNCKVEQSASA